MYMELRVLNYFLTVAREGGLTGASEVLHVTQPTMSRQIQELEEELGQKTTVVVTGGIAKFVIPMCRTPMIYDQDLLLKGLAALYRDNRKN
jgi:pantothenate kinase type III